MKKRGRVESKRGRGTKKRKGKRDGRRQNVDGVCAGCSQPSQPSQSVSQRQRLEGTCLQLEMDGASSRRSGAPASEGSDSSLGLTFLILFFSLCAFTCATISSSPSISGLFLCSLLSSLSLSSLVHCTFSFFSFIAWVKHWNGLRCAKENESDILMHVDMCDTRPGPVVRQE